MRPRVVLFAIAMAVGMACWFGVRAQQNVAAGPLPIDPDQVAAITSKISQRSAHLAPMLDQVHVAEWVAKGAPEAYVAQWKSLREQNLAIGTEMSVVGEHPEAMQAAMQAVFRVDRFDNDLAGLLGSLRRYQNPALADLIESVALDDRNAVGKLQQYVLELAGEKERQLDVEDKEAQRCRGLLAGQPVNRAAAPRKTTGSK
jgi:hypothetical protein